MHALVLGDLAQLALPAAPAAPLGQDLARVDAWSESGLGLGLGLANRYDLARVDAWGDNQVTQLSG